VIRILRGAGSAEQQDRFFREFAAGDKLAGFCLTEPNFGSDAGSLQTRAVAEGDHYIINGTKSYITLAPMLIITWFRPYRPGQTNRRISALVVPGIRRDLPSAGRSGRWGSAIPSPRKWFYQRPGAQGKPASGRGGGLAHPGPSGQPHAVWGAASLALGIAEGAYEAALDFARKRTQFKRKIASSRPSAHAGRHEDLHRGGNRSSTALRP